MWTLIPNAHVVLGHVEEKIKDVGLRTYLLSYAAFYGSVSLDSLVQRFELDEKLVYRTCSKMMVNEQLQGAWDDKKNIITHASVTNKLQRAALQYAEKVSLLVEQNERLMEQKFGYSNHNNNRWGGDNNNNNNNYYGNYRRSSFAGGNRGSYDLGGGRTIKTTQ